MTSKRILAVDDDPTILVSLQHILKEGYIVLTATGGHQAMDLLELYHGQVDLIVLDLSMPDMNGAVLYLQIVEKYPGLNDRILFMTGGPYGAYIDEVFANNKNPCLIKPFNIEELHRIIKDFFLNNSKPKDNDKI